MVELKEKEKVIELAKSYARACVRIKSWVFKQIFCRIYSEGDIALYVNVAPVFVTTAILYAVPLIQL